MATKVDKEFLADANQRLGKSYSNLKDYLSDGGRLKTTDSKYVNRKAALDNWRGKSKREGVVTSGKLLEEARKIYGSAADLYNIPELKSIFETAFVNQWEPAELLRAIDNTEWAKSRTAAQETYDVLETVDPTQAAANVEANVPLVRRALTAKNITLTDEQIRTIAQKGTRGGWTGNQWDEYSASEAVSLSGVTDTGAVAPTATPVSAVSATDLRGIAKQFGVPVAESTINQWVADIATNAKTREGFGEYARASAQTLYPGLSERLKTNSFDEIVSPYKRLYSDVLETPEDNIDLTDPKFSNLFTSGDSAKPRMMTSTEWVGFLRKRPEWQNTQNAYREYSEAAETLNKIFGGYR
jgi:hypothetical protein